MKRIVCFAIALGVMFAPTPALATGSLSKAVGLNTLASAKLAGASTSKQSSASKTTSSNSASSILPTKTAAPKVAPTKNQLAIQPIVQPIIQPINRVIQPVIKPVVQPVINTTVNAPITLQPTVLAPKFVGTQFSSAGRSAGTANTLTAFRNGSTSSASGTFISQTATAGAPGSGVYGTLGKFCGLGGAFSSTGSPSFFASSSIGQPAGLSFNSGSLSPRGPIRGAPKAFKFGNGRRFGGGSFGFGGFGKANFIGSLFSSFASSPNAISTILGGKTGSKAFNFSSSFSADGIDYQLDLSGSISARFAGSSASPSSAAQF